MTDGSTTHASTPPSPPAPRLRSLLGDGRKWLWSLAAAAPFFSVYVAHLYGAADRLPTGFVQYDQPYYLANARAIFDRGNGFQYPNPYDPDADAPAVYFHLVVWCLGAIERSTGADPGLLLAGAGLLAGLLMSRLTFAIVELSTPAPRPVIALFLASLWGGGIYTLAAICWNLQHGRSLGENLMRFDPALGHWFQNWGRNLIYPMECCYHCLMLLVWLGMMRNRWGLALAALTLLAASHPFTGLQGLAIVGAWRVVCLLTRRRAPRWVDPWLAAIVGVFGCYYFLYLPQFPQHRALVQVWSLDWVLEPSAILFGYGPLLGLTAVRLIVDRRRLDAADAFLVVAFVVSFLLADHQWFLRAHQPLHFTRGYLWLPLFLLCLPILQRRQAALIARGGRWTAGLFVGVALFAASLDNLAFLFHFAGTHQSFYLTPAQKSIFDQARGQRLAGILLCPDERLSYLTPVYTALRPYRGHYYNTPDFPRRAQEIDRLFSDGIAGPWFDDVDYLLIERGDPPKLAPGTRWRTVALSPPWALYERVRSAERHEHGRQGKGVRPPLIHR